MKRYSKEIEGKIVIKQRNQIVLHKTRIVKDKNGNEKEIRMQVINPKEVDILADGWVEYIEPHIEPTEDELLETAKMNLIEDIAEYDASSNVNIFKVNGVDMWLDKATRTGLMLRFQAEQALGRTETTLWYEGMPISLPIEIAIHILYALEVYASACYDNTQRHIGNVKVMSNINEVKSYVYKEGYPEVLQFNL